MGVFVDTQKVKAEINLKVLGGAKIPHITSFPMLRMVDGTLYLAVYVIPDNRENMLAKVMERPSHWYLADLEDGHLVKAMHCREEDFCSAPWDRKYPRGKAARAGTVEDILELYRQLDEIRRHYLEDGILDAFAYRDYRNRLFDLLPSGEINFYRELSKLR